MKIEKIIFNFIIRKNLQKPLKKFNVEPLFPSKEFMNEVMDSYNK